MIGSELKASAETESALARVITSVVPERALRRTGPLQSTNRSFLRTSQWLIPAERLLEEHRQKTANLYCHGCGHLCETAAHGVPVATVLRYLRYYQAYGKRQEARALYAALPAAARAAAEVDLSGAEAAAPGGALLAQYLQLMALGQQNGLQPGLLVGIQAQFLSKVLRPAVN